MYSKVVTANTAERINMKIEWEVEEVCIEENIERQDKSETTISMFGDEVHIYGVLSFDELKQTLTKMEELQK